MEFLAGSAKRLPGLRAIAVNNIQQRIEELNALLTRDGRERAVNTRRPRDMFPVRHAGGHACN